MKAKTLVVMITLLTIVATGTVTPAPVRATETWVIVTGGIALYVGFVVVGTILYQRSRVSDLMQTNPSESDPKPHDGVGFVQRCPQTSGNLTLVCW